MRQIICAVVGVILATAGVSVIHDWQAWAVVLGTDSKGEQ